MRTPPLQEGDVMFHCEGHEYVNNMRIHDCPCNTVVVQVHNWQMSLRE